MRYKGVVCEKCGVEVIQSRVRRERMAHIDLVSPVCHIWYLKGIPSYLSLILNMPVKELERVIYFDAYMVVRQGKSPYPIKTLLNISRLPKTNWIIKEIILSHSTIHARKIAMRQRMTLPL